MNWINLEDESPKEYQKVLCLTGNSIGYATWIDNKFRYGKFLGFRPPFYFSEMNCYWMPLPKLPKEKE